MVQSMGFDPLECQISLRNQCLFDGTENHHCALRLPKNPVNSPSTTAKSRGHRLDRRTDRNADPARLRWQTKAQVQQQVEQHNLRVSPACPRNARRNLRPITLTVCARRNQLRLLEPESYLYTQGRWSLLDFPVELPQFEIRESGRVFEVFLQGGHVSYKLAEQGETPNLNLIELDIDDTVLVRWLDRGAPSRCQSR